MKKVLAIVLALTMALGMFGIAASAESVTYDQIPAIPTQEKGRIYFVAGSTVYPYGESGIGTYEVPIYLVSDYDTDYEVGFVELGCTIAIEGDTSMATIIDVKPTAALEAMKGYVDIDTGYGINEDEYTFAEDQGHVAFKVDGSAILHQEKLQVATVTVELNDTYKVDLKDKNATAPYIYLMEYDFSFTGPSSVYGAGAIWAADGQEYGTWGDFNPDGAEPTEELQLGSASSGALFYTYGYICEGAEVVITWKTDLINWFTGILDQFYQIYTTIHNFFQDLLPSLGALL